MFCDAGSDTVSEMQPSGSKVPSPAWCNDQAIPLLYMEVFTPAWLLVGKRFMSPLYLTSSPKLPYAGSKTTNTAVLNVSGCDQCTGHRRNRTDEAYMAQCLVSVTVLITNSCRKSISKEISTSCQTCSTVTSRKCTTFAAYHAAQRQVSIEHLFMLNDLFESSKSCLLQ